MDLYRELSMKRYCLFVFFSFFFSAFTLMSAHLINFDRLMNEEFDELENFSLHGLHNHSAENVWAMTSENPPHPWIEPTPSQGRGPFYPVRMPSEVDTDLTIINEGPQARGVPVYVQGQIMDQSGQIIKNATIEIWQACATGKYNHPRDSNTAEVDPNFQYYGTTKSDETGKYIFKTIVPGPYPADTNWWRPPHVHFLVSAPGFHSLTTQSYFDGNSFLGEQEINGEIINRYNNDDLMLRELPVQDRTKLIVRFRAIQELGNTKLGVFNIYLRRK